MDEPPKIPPDNGISVYGNVIVTGRVCVNAGKFSGVTELGKRTGTL
jgi:hypothetical protein